MDSKDKKFLEDMVPHHQMAIDMGKEILKSTADKYVQALAGGIIEDQTNEIIEMNEALAGDTSESNNATTDNKTKKQIKMQNNKSNIKMKYPNIALLVPTREHFDESAIINEGGYLTTGHLANIEKWFTDSTAAAITVNESLSAKDAELVTANENLVAANANLTEAKTAADALNSTITSLQSEASTSKTTIDTHVARIAALESEVAVLGAKPSGTGSSVKSLGDEHSETTPVPSYASDDNAGNAWIDKRLKKAK